MSPNLEERLEAHLGNKTIRPAADTDQLAWIKRSARNRSLRTRLAVGACGLIALAGFGSLIPSGDESNALVTATEPAPTTIEPAVIDPTAQAQTGPTPDADVGEVRALTPDGYEIVADGQGGFVALEFRTTSGTVNFARSSDGENWFKAESGELPEGFLVQELVYADGNFVLVLDKEGRERGVNAAPYIALSTDLITWQVIDLELGPDDRTDGELVQYSIGQIAFNGDDIAVVVLEASDIDYERYELREASSCGFIEESGALTLVLCDGTLLPLDAPPVGRPRLLQRVLLIRDGESPIDLPGFTPQTLDPWRLSGSDLTPIAQADPFIILDPNSYPVTLVDPQTKDVLSQMGDVRGMAAATRAGQTLTIVEAGETLVPVLTTEAGDVVGNFPGLDGIRAGNDSMVQIKHGPAGWVVGLFDQTSLWVQVERDGWVFSGVAGSATGRLRSVDGSRVFFYNSLITKLPPGVHMSLFGGARYMHPGTGEVLIELTAAETASATAQALRTSDADFDAVIEVDGWTLGGHPLLGPLTLTSPAGTTTEYSDGFAFDNDDITDGVEADIGTAAFGDFALQRAGRIRFYDDTGNELVAIGARKIFEELVAPVLEASGVTGADSLRTTPFMRAPDSAVLFSPDGIEWEILWSNAEDSALSNGVVGDDEVLLAIPMEILRIPIDD